MIGKEEIIRMIANRVKDAPAEKALKQIADRLRINEDDLNREMADQPGLYAYAAVGDVYWDSQADDVRLARKTYEAALDKAIRSDTAVKGGKITEAAIAKEIANNKRHQELEAEELEHRATSKIFRAIAQALRDRKDMLISIGANRRAELDATEMKINDAHVRHRAGAVPANAARKSAPPPRQRK